jgi:hypothetical protein
MGIAKLDLQATSTSLKDNGNTVGLVSSFEDREGNLRTMADVWFVTDKQSATPGAPPPILTVEPTPLQAGVFGLVDAMAAFGRGETSQSFGITADAPVVAAGVQADNSARLTLSSTASQLAQALSQFDANGRPVALVAAEQTLLGLAPTDAKPRDPAAGLLFEGNG